MEDTTTTEVQSHPGNQPDEYVDCPYFPEHKLRKSRLPYHLIKCQRNPNAPKLLACPFNYTHRIRPEEQKDHSLLCPDKPLLKFVNKDVPSHDTTLRKVFGVRVEDDRHKIEKTMSQPGSDSDGEWW